MSSACLFSGAVASGAGHVVPVSGADMILSSCCILFCVLYERDGKLQAGRAVQALFAAGACMILISASRPAGLCGESLGTFATAAASVSVPEPCIKTVARMMRDVWLFLISDEGHFVFGSAATLRAIVYYLRRSEFPEAHQLANAIITASILLGAAALAGSGTLAKDALRCTGGQSVAKAKILVWTQEPPAAGLASRYLAEERG